MTQAQALTAYESQLFERIQALEERVAQLEATTAPEIDYGGDDLAACHTHTCDYFTHYLAQGPAELPHEGFHAASKRLVVASEHLQHWYDENQDNYRPTPPHLTSMIGRLEELVRA